MSTRRSARLALSGSMRDQQVALSAPVTKRRRQDTPGASGGKNKKAGQIESLSEDKEDDETSSTVIIPLPDDFSISQTACR